MDGSGEESGKEARRWIWRDWFERQVRQNGVVLDARVGVELRLVDAVWSEC